MTFEHEEVTPEHPAVVALVAELNAALKAITSDTGENSFSRDTFSAATDGCLLVSLNGKAIACGVFRNHGPEVCEVKRMYSKQKGAGSYLLSQLEAFALSKGYKQAVLSTRVVNETAVSFYRRHGYKEVAPYGKYKQTGSSICLGKALCDG